MHLDVHSHYIGPRFLRLIEADGARYATSLEPRDAGGPVLRLDGSPRDVLTPGHVSLEARLRAMDAAAIDVQVLSAPPYLSYARLDGEAALAACRAHNEDIAAAVAAHPARFVGLASVPLQAIDLALGELDRAVGSLGLRGAVILTQWAGTTLDDPSLLPFYRALRALDVPVLVHPAPPASRDDRDRAFRLDNLVVYPGETTLAVARLLFAGVLDEVPGLRVIASHLGGTLPYLVGRLSLGVHAYAECRSALTRPIADAVREVYVDTVSFHAPAIDCAIRTLGIERLLLASDFPYPGGLEESVASIRQLDDLGADDVEKICWENGAALFGLEPRHRGDR